jgi:hypothetical protein
MAQKKGSYGCRRSLASAGVAKSFAEDLYLQGVLAEQHAGKQGFHQRTACVVALALPGKMAGVARFELSAGAVDVAALQHCICAEICNATHFCEMPRGVTALHNSGSVPSAVHECIASFAGVVSSATAAARKC